MALRSPRSRRSTGRPGRSRRWRQAATAVLGLAATGGLVLILDPAKVGHAMTLFPLEFIPALVAMPGPD